MSRRERILYPLRVAVLLVIGSIVVYTLFSTFPIVYSIYIAFTDASAKNIAPGPRLEELRKTRDNIVSYLEERREYIVGEARRASELLEESMTILRELREVLDKATPETISITYINKVKSDVDSRILEVKSIVTSNKTMLYLDPRVRDPIDRASRILDYRVWQPIESIILYKLEVTREDLDRIRRDVIPSLDEVIAYMGSAAETLRSIEVNYDAFIESSVEELNREINELTLHFIGLDNFRRLFGDSRFPYSMLKTILFVATSVPLKVLAGLMLAFIFTSQSIYGRRFLRAFLLIPWAIPVLLSVTTWRILFTPERGQLTTLIEGYLGYRLDIYVNEWHAFLAYNIVEMWLAYPFVMTVTMAAIASIPREYVEAALVDGARSVQVLKDIVIPLILRPVAFAAILTTGASLQAFMVPLLINNGGPAKIISLPGFTPATGYSNEMMVLYGYNRAWLDQDYGLSTAAFLIVVSILLVYAIAWYYLFYRRGWASV